eukprot:4458653-Prymnesium_polylepis.1
MGASGCLLHFLYRLHLDGGRAPPQPADSHDGQHVGSSLFEPVVACRTLKLLVAVRVVAATSRRTATPRSCGGLSSRGSS